MAFQVLIMFQVGLVLLDVEKGQPMICSHPRSGGKEKGQLTIPWLSQVQDAGEGIADHLQLSQVWRTKRRGSNDPTVVSHLGGKKRGS